MITSFEVGNTAPFVRGAAFGATGPYVRIDGTAIGEIDPAHAGNAGITLLDKAPRNSHGRVEYRTDVTILRPADPARGNGRLLYEVNNRGRMMLFANLCAGTAGNQPKTEADLGNALPLKLGFMLMWSGWDAGAPRINGGLALEAPVAELEKRGVGMAASRVSGSGREEIARIVRETINEMDSGVAKSAAKEIDERQREEIERVLGETKGRVGGAEGAAARLGINRTTLLFRMKKLGIDPKLFC